MRGRNNNRKGPNPLTRTYESNGPDVKIRGSAQQVADKYATLARDAQSSGDRVMAENYLQHAEHYNRIIAAATAQAQTQRESREEREDRDDSDDGDTEINERSRQPREAAPAQGPANDGSGPQPVIEGTPAEVALGEQQAQPDRRRGRGRRPANGSDAQQQDGAEGSEGESGSDESPRKRPVRRPRKAAAPAEQNGGGGSGEAEGGDDGSLTTAAGE
jgi:hypothetical protein